MKSIEALGLLSGGKALPVVIFIVVLGVLFLSLDLSLKLNLRFRGLFRSGKGQRAEIPKPCPLGGGEDEGV